MIGWFLIRPVNALLGWFFGGFNRVFDKITAQYGWAVGKLLRVSAIVCWSIVGLLGLTTWRVASAPQGFLPTQDQGYLLVNVQLPDSASVQRTEEVMAQIDKIARGDPDDREHYPGIPGIAHTVGISGQSFLQNINGSNLGSMFVVLRAVGPAAGRPVRRRDRAEAPAAVRPGNRRRSGRRLSSAADPGSG